MRKAFQKAGIRTPHYQAVSSVDDIDLKCINLPVIVKPTDRSGSRAITKVSKIEELNQAVNKAIANSFEKCAMIEDFLEGDEYSCECITFEGIHHFLAMTKKYTTGAPNFIETGHIQPSGLSENIINNVTQIVFSALDALGMRFGASHSEFKIDSEGNICLIEIGARMGGDCIGSDLVQISTGYDFLQMVIDVSCGNRPLLLNECDTKIAYVRFIFNYDDLNQLRRIQDEYPECVYLVSDIAPINSHEITDSSSRYGYYILAVNNAEKFNRIIENERK
jgi:biotin carboxylase